MHSVCVFDRIPDFDKLETYAPGINFLTENTKQICKKVSAVSLLGKRCWSNWIYFVSFLVFLAGKKNTFSMNLTECLNVGNKTWAKQHSIQIEECKLMLNLFTDVTREALKSQFIQEIWELCKCVENFETRKVHFMSEFIN